MRAIGIGLALALSLSSDAFAVSKDEQKADCKEAKGRWKDVAKLAEKWAEAQEEREDTATYDDELRPFYDEEIAYLRAAGLDVRSAPEELSSGAVVEVDPEDPEPQPKLEELRSVVLPLKNGEIMGKHKAAALEQYAKLLEERYERKLERCKTSS